MTEPVTESVTEPVIEAAPQTDTVEVTAETAAAAPVAETTQTEPARQETPKPKKRLGPPGSFPVNTAWMNLAGCGAEELHRLLWALGYKPLSAKDPESGETVTLYIRSQKAIVAKRKREQDKRREEEAKMADSPFAALMKLKQQQQGRR